MTDFSLTDGYRVCNGLDQDEVFSPFLWKIFYDSLLCKVKSGGLSFFFAAGAFVDNTIWINDCQALMQYALNIASKFFAINNISINNEKTGVKVASLSISGQPISIARKSEAYRYLGIFLSIEGLFKPSVAKAYSNVHFFANMVLKKVITDKQFSYLVSAKNLRSKAHLLHNFPVEVLYYLLLYGLKSFEQVQSECKLTAVISFSNASGIFGCLFNHRFLDLQILGWALLNPLQFSVKLHVSSVNNFLASVVKIFLDNKLSLANNLPSAFYSPDAFPILFVLKNALYFSLVCSLKHFGVTFSNRLVDKKDSKGPVSFWFVTVSKFLLNVNFLLVVSAGSGLLPELDVLNSVKFSNSGLFDIYTNGFLRNARTTNVAGSMTAYFPSVNLSVGVKVQSLLSSTLSELQVVALVLECISFSCIVVLYLNSQTAIDTCVFEIVKWVKIKGHSGVIDNVEADAAAGCATCFKLSLPIRVHECFLVAEATAVFGNVYYFVRDVFQSIYHAHWEAGPGQNIILSDLMRCVD
ncbi:hypothetical protein G9A89_023094 [Geosiphon pyriformis]|nr:hypothetical protein G9A89_023094 [Geosiphon pyriformis]